MSDSKMKCPFCFEDIPKDSKKCSFCKEEFINTEKNNNFKKNEDDNYHCTACKEKIHKDAQICKHCGARLTPMGLGEVVHQSVSEGVDFIWKVIITVAVLFFMMWGCVALM